jgi:hypothetical protein
MELKIKLKFLIWTFIDVTVFLRSRDSPVGVVIKLWAGQSGVRMPAEAKDLYLLQNVPTDSRANPVS